MFDGIENAGRKREREPTLTVVRSSELERVKALPRRTQALTHDLTSYFRKTGGTLSLKLEQNIALWEASVANGLFADMGCGSGKTLVTLLLPEVMNSKSAVIFTAPSLIEKTHRDIAFYSEHFDLKWIGRNVHVVAYTTLSNADNADILERLKPDLVIADECHCIRPGSARTKRLHRWFRANPCTRFCGLSGSPTKTSFMDYADLLELALRKNSPAPLGYHERLDWSGAIDPKPREPRGPGALLSMGSPGEDVRTIFRKRLTETLGVVTTGESYLDTGLIIRKPISFELPVAVSQALTGVRSNWAIGDDELDSILAQYRVLRQLACGFHYAWVPPVDQVWVEARKAWHREVRIYLTHSARAGMDSPLLLARAAASGRWESEAWAAWAQIKDQAPPDVRAVWLSDFLVQAALKWAKGRNGAIIWYEHVAFGEAVAKAGGLPLYDGGTDAGLASAPVIVCSMKAQGTGKNLQQGYSQNLLTSVPSGQQFEQVISRTHREGQPADDVEVSWFGYTEEAHAAWARVIAESEYVKQTTGSTYRILTATIE